MRTALACPPRPRRLIWLVLLVSILAAGCTPTSTASTAGTEQAEHTERAALEVTGGDEREVTTAEESTTPTPAPVSPVEAPPVVAVAATDEPAEAPCTASTPAQFLAVCLDSECTPVRQRLRGYAFYSCDDGVPWEVWASRETPEGLTMFGPLVSHNVEEDMDSYSVLEDRRVEAIERRMVGDQGFFFTAVSYVVSGEVPDSRGRQSLYELSAAVLISVCGEDGTCPIQNAMAWYGSHEQRRAYRASDASLVRRGMEWRSAIAVEGTRVTITHRYRHLQYRVPDDVVSADLSGPSTPAATAE